MKKTLFSFYLEDVGDLGEALKCLQSIKRSDFKALHESLEDEPSQVRRRAGRALKCLRRFLNAADPRGGRSRE